MNTTARIAMAGLLAAVCAACSGTKTYLADSRPLDRRITVDGRADDWTGRLNVIPDAKFEVGFLNDQQNLYVTFVTEDKALKEAILKGGLTIWFDPRGKDRKALGIKYPLGLGKAQKSGELEFILDDGKSPASRRALSLGDLKGVELATSPEGGLFVYELMIPLQAGVGRPFAVGAGAGATIGIGFEVPKSPLGPMGDRPPGGDGMMGGGGVPGGGMPGGGMMPGSGMMGGRRQDGGDPQMADPDAAGGLKMWTYVRLSAAKTPATAPIAR